MIEAFFPKLFFKYCEVSTSLLWPYFFLRVNWAINFSFCCYWMFSSGVVSFIWDRSLWFCCTIPNSSKMNVLGQEPHAWLAQKFHQFDLWKRLYNIFNAQMSIFSVQNQKICVSYFQRYIKLNNVGFTHTQNISRQSQKMATFSHVD